MRIEEYKQKIINIIDNNYSYEKKLQTICDFLKEAIDYYDWVGFYFKNGDKNELKLTHFSGEPTEHMIIPFGKGICGQVAESNENFVVQDVSEQDNYISCGIDVNSEIVIPIIVNNENIGQIDIDSHSLRPFTKYDVELLEFVCSKVAEISSEND